MKKIFLFLLRQYSKTEKNRLQIFEILHNQVINEYSEQTTFGNVYNANIEFIMACPFVKQLVEEKDVKSQTILCQGLNTSFGDAIKHYENEIEKIKNKTN